MHTGDGQHTDSGIRTVTQPLAEASAYRRACRGDDGGHVQIHDSPDSLLSETERDIIGAIGGERGETLRRSLVNNRRLLSRAREDVQGTRADANRTAAAMRLDVSEYLSLLEGRFAAEFRDIGTRLGGLIRSRKRSVVRLLRGV